MARTRTIRLVTPGQQRNGQTVTLAHLTQAVESYEPTARPPVSLGHPTDSRVLAFGRAQAPRIEAGALVLEIAYTPELERLEDGGYVEGFSAGLYPHPSTGRYYLHHVAALGELPPAADTKTLAADVLPPFDAGKVLALAAEPIRDKTGAPDMTKEELQAAIAAGLAPVNEQIKTLAADLERVKAAAKPADGKGDDDGAGKPPAADPQIKVQLDAALATIASDRIALVAEGMRAKGLSDDQAKPLLDMLRALPPVELAADTPESPYARMRAHIAALADPTPADDITRPLELADAKGQAIDTQALATKF
jgi:hypothetical protein